MTNGVVFINDILDTDGKLYSYENFSRIYGIICTQIEYNQLISAIPLPWKQLFKRDNGGKLLVCTPVFRNRKCLTLEKTSLCQRHSPPQKQFAVVARRDLVATIEMEGIV